MNNRERELEVFIHSIDLAEDWRLQGKWIDTVTFLEGLRTVSKYLNADAQVNILLLIGRTLTDEALFGGKENHDQRRSALEQAHKLAKEANNKALLGNVYDAIGFSLHTDYLNSDRSQEPEEEMDFFERGLDLRKKYGSHSQVAESTFHIGLVHDVIRQEYDKALPYHQEAYKLAKEAGDKMIMSYAIRHIGFTKMGTDDLTGAKQAFSESLNLRESIGFIPGIAFALTTMAQVEFMEKNNNEALVLLKKARKLLSSLKVTPRVEWIDSMIAEITNNQ